MIEIAGKQVLTELAELVDPSRAALVIIDMQRDFVEPGFAFDRLGVDLSMYPPVRARIATLLAAARSAGVLVVHVQMTSLPGNITGGRFRFTEHGDAGHDFVAELAPLPGELVVPKWRSSGFWGTSLDLLLRSNGIETVVITGCTTEGCVESTARDALFNDYYAVIVEDCVGSDDRAQHDASMLLMRHRFDIASSNGVDSAWKVAMSNRKASA